VKKNRRPKNPEGAKRSSNKKRIRFFLNFFAAGSGFLGNLARHFPFSEAAVPGMVQGSDSARVPD